MDRSGFMMWWRMGGRSLGVLALLFGLIAGYCSQPAEAMVILTQITRSSSTAGPSGYPSINADGTRIAFASSSDLTGGNPDGGEEIFLWTQGAVPPITQITNTTGCCIYFPSINADGTRIAFASSSDLTGGNPDHNWEIFLWTQGAVPPITQITNTTGGGSGFNGTAANHSPSISADGTRIAFSSNKDLTPGSPGNADGNYEIFLWTQGSGLKQITNSPGGYWSINPSINADGTRIAFMSNSDPTGGGNPGGIILWTLGSDLVQITKSTDGYSTSTFRINADGTRIAIMSASDLTGNNPDHDWEIFLWTQGSGLKQITNSPGGYWSINPSINADGTRIAFMSNSDPTGDNPGGAYEFFLWTSGSGIRQITTQYAGNGSNGIASINSDGTRIAFDSSMDLTGGNPDGNSEIFLATLSTVPPNPPVLSVSPSSFDFGTIAVGASKDLTFTVTNTGSGTLTGSAGGVSAPFSVLSPSSFSLTNGQTQDITVRFSPTAGGTFVSNVTFTSNGGNASIVVTGEATTKPHIQSLSPTSGPIGTSVTILGFNFGTGLGTSTVKFGSKPAHVNSWSGTKIETLVPSLAPGTYDVTVTTKNGTSNALLFTVTTSPLPPPTISSINPTSGTAGTLVTINGKNFGATQGSSVLRFGTLSATPNSWSDAKITAPAPAGLHGTVPVTVTTFTTSNADRTFTDVLSTGSDEQTFFDEISRPPILTRLAPSVIPGLGDGALWSTANDVLVSQLENAIVGNSGDCEISAWDAARQAAGEKMVLSSFLPLIDTLLTGPLDPLFDAFSLPARILIRETVTFAISFTNDAALGILNPQEVRADATKHLVNLTVGYIAPYFTQSYFGGTLTDLALSGSTAALTTLLHKDDSTYSSAQATNHGTSWQRGGGPLVDAKVTLAYSPYTHYVTLFIRAGGLNSECAPDQRIFVVRYQVERSLLGLAVKGGTTSIVYVNL